MMCASLLVCVRVLMCVSVGGWVCVDDPLFLGAKGVVSRMGISQVDCKNEFISCYLFCLFIVNTGFREGSPRLECKVRIIVRTRG